MSPNLRVNRSEFVNGGAASWFGMGRSGRDEGVGPVGHISDSVSPGPTGVSHKEENFQWKLSKSFKEYSEPWIPQEFWWAQVSASISVI